MQGPFEFNMAGVGGPGCPVGRMLMQKILAAFKLCCVQINIDPHFVDILVAFHRGETNTIPKPLFIQHLKHLNQQFQHFAMLHKEFLSLPKRDKQSLVARNSPLFVQYILGRYFTSESGFEQLNWLLGIHAPIMTEEEKSKVKVVPLSKFNKRIGLFRKGSDLSTYKEFCDRLNCKYLKFRTTSIWNHIILYQYSLDMMLEDTLSVHNLCEDAMSILPHISSYFNGIKEKPNIAGMITTAEAMVRFFKHNVQWMIPISDDSSSSSSGDEESIKFIAKTKFVPLK